MKDLSLTQEYFLCAINDKGNMPALKSMEVSICFLVAGIIELKSQGFIAQNEGKRLVVTKPWDGTLPYLEPLYEKIASFKKPKKAHDLLVSYDLGLSPKPFLDLLSALGASLVAAGYADEVFHNKKKYKPKPEAVTRIIEKVRAEFLEDGSISEEMRFLVSLLDVSYLIRNYFSKVEVTVLKNRLKVARENDTYSSTTELLGFAEAMIAIAIAAIASTINVNTFI